MVEELDLFSFTMPEYKIRKPIRLIEMFGGIGCQAKALKNLGVEFEHWRYYEIDQNPVNSYNAIFNTEFKPQDICQVHAKDLGIDDDSYCYISTYSFPCQDLSQAGKMRGMSKGSSTRSGLLWEVERILDECVEYNGKLPDILIMENVPAVVGKVAIKDFQSWRRKLESLGYSNYVQMCNAKSIGWPEPLPQNRNRCFMISILGEYHYTFPQKQPLKLKLKDVLEENVDEKYYLSDKALSGILHEEQGNVNKTLNINNATKKGYLEAEPGDGIDLSTRPKNHRGTVQKEMSQTIQTEITVGVVDGTETT